MKRKLGLVLGRFQPLHDGHKYLIEKAFEESDEVVVCIGSAQKAEPLPIEERHRRVEEYLRDSGGGNYRIVDLVDPESKDMDKWPSYVKEVCEITDWTENFLYRADNDLTDAHRKDLEDSGFKLRFVDRISFSYVDPNGEGHEVNSATDIKKVHQELGLEGQI